MSYKSALAGVSGYLRSDIVLEVSARSLVHIQSMLSEVVPIKDLEYKKSLITLSVMRLSYKYNIRKTFLKRLLSYSHSIVAGGLEEIS